MSSVAGPRRAVDGFAFRVWRITLCCRPESRAAPSAVIGTVVEITTLVHGLPRGGGCSALSRLARRDSRALSLHPFRV